MEVYANLQEPEHLAFRVNDIAVITSLLAPHSFSISGQQYTFATVLSIISSLWWLTNIEINTESRVSFLKSLVSIMKNFEQKIMSIMSA